VNLSGTYDIEGVARKHKESCLRTYLREKQVPMKVIKRASVYLEAYFDHVPCWDEENIVGELPNVLMKDLVQYIRVDSYEMLDALKSQSALMIHHIAKHLKLQFYSTGEIVYRQKDSSMEWYHVCEGAVVLTHHSSVFENNTKMISSHVRDFYRAKYSDDDVETNKRRVRRCIVEGEKDTTQNRSYETIVTDVIRMNGHFRLFESVFGLKRSRNAVCVTQSKLLQLDKEDLCRLVEQDDDFPKLLKKIIRARIFHFEGEIGPWTKEESEYVMNEVKSIKSNEKLISKKESRFHRDDTAASLRSQQAWLSPHPCALEIRKKYWTLKQQQKNTKISSRRPTKSKEKTNDRTKRRWSLIDCVGSAVRAKRVRMALLRYLNECTSFDITESQHHENHHWSARDEKRLHIVVSSLGHTFRSLESIRSSIGGSNSIHHDESSENATMLLLMRCGFLKMDVASKPMSNSFGTSGASDYSYEGDSKTSCEVESKSG